MNAPDLKPSFARLDLDELMEQIRAEVAERKQHSGSDARFAEPVTASSTDFESRSWSARDLLALPVAEFARATHLAFLGREATPEEFVRLRDRLLGGVGRMRILREFRASAEPRARGARVQGLRQELAWDRVYWSPPAKFGRFILRGIRHVVLFPWRIRKFVLRVEALEKLAVEAAAALRTLKAAQLSDRQNATSQFRRLRDEAESRNRSIASRSDAIERKFSERTGDIEKKATETLGVMSELQQQLVDHWRNITEQRWRFDALGAVAKSQSDGNVTSDVEAQPGRQEDPALDALYLSFEDRFRGTREDIKNRQRIYLPRIEACVAATGGAPVVDAGCGRGEWLEVLLESGISARGFDLNRIAVAECLQRGLDAALDDAARAIASLPDGSLAAVTAFHIIEHIPFEGLVHFLDQSLRVLRPGGLLVLETPNPANLLVAAERFYMDPTHRNPLPSELVSYLVKSRGFGGVEVLPLHPVEWPSRRSYDDPMLACLQEKLFGAQDYGVIARKEA